MRLSVALALYAATGFESQGRRRDYYGPGLDAVVMRRRLLGAEDAQDDFSARFSANRSFDDRSLPEMPSAARHFGSMNE